MDIMLKKANMSFEEFVLDKNIRQCTISDEKYLRDGKFFYKLCCENGTDAIFVRNYFHGKVTISEYDKYEFYMIVDYENKFIINCYDYRFNYDLSIFEQYNYKALSFNAYEKLMAETFASKIQEILDGNFEKYMGIDPEYRQSYNNVLEDIEGNENTYLYRGGVFFYPAHNEQKTFDIEQLINFAQHPEYMDEYVKEYVNKKEEHLKRSHAREKARAQALKDIAETPSERVSMILKIQKAIENGGNTINVTTFAGRVIKVDNKLRVDDTFKSSKGWSSIHCKEIEKITFGKKVLYEAV